MLLKLMVMNIQYITTKHFLVERNTKDAKTKILCGSTA